ncbi:MAG: hypothetical protein J6T27_03000 [Alphaproteobacteria bacterium]|nr:hypothetical protein [Alphaproteobacteria bacterium]
MKKTILTGLFGAFVATCAIASDGGVYSETETFTNSVRYNTNTVTYAEPAQERVAYAYANTCNSCAQPVRVKTYTEVVDHYQVYRPVTVYEPAGVFSERRVIRNNTCGRCNG